MLNQHGTDGNQLDEEKTETEPKVKQNLESTSWPLISNNKKYDLKLDESHTEHQNEAKQIPTSITADRIVEAESIYIGIPQTVVEKKTESTSTDNLASDLDSSSANFKTDKSYQVNPVDLLGRQMVDTQTQITPPVSPTRTHAASSSDHSFLSNHSGSENKVSVATETDIVVAEAKEERSQSIAVQTSIEDEPKEIESLAARVREPVVIEKVDSPRVKPLISTTTTTTTMYSPRIAEKPISKLKDNKIDQDLDDEQCLNILQDMKRMDDDIKHELSKINEEESRKNELFELIKNYQVLNKQERARLETLLNKNESSSLGSSSPAAQANVSSQRQKIQIQNISLDAYLKTLDDNSEFYKPTPSKSVDKVEIKVNPAAKKDILPKPYLPTTETSDGIPTSAILAAKLHQKNQSISEIDIKVQEPAKKAEVNRLG